MVQNESQAEKYKNLIMDSLYAEIEVSKIKDCIKKGGSYYYNFDISNKKEKLKEVSRCDAQEYLDNIINMRESNKQFDIEYFSRLLESSYLDLLKETGYDIEEMTIKEIYEEAECVRHSLQSSIYESESFLDMTKEEKAESLISEAESRAIVALAELRVYSLAEALNIKNEQVYNNTVGKYNVNKLGSISDEDFQELIEIITNDPRVKKKVSGFKYDNVATVLVGVSIFSFLITLLLGCITGNNAINITSAVMGCSMIPCAVFGQIIDKWQEIKLPDLDKYIEKVNINKQENEMKL